jgi:hypothetical protein
MKKSNMKIWQYFFLILMCIPGGALIGQGDEDDNGLDMEIISIGTLNLFLKDANKEDAWPQFKENMLEMPTLSYTLIPNKLNADIEPKPITPVKVKMSENLPKLYKGYAKLGFGTQVTTLGELYYMDGRSRKGTFSIHAKHLSSAGNTALADSIPDSFSRNEVHLFGKRFVKKHTLEGGIDWERDVLHWYGFDPEVFPTATKDNIQQQYNNIDGYVRLRSYSRDSSDVNYLGEIKFYNYRDHFEGTENNLDLTAHARKFSNTELLSMDFALNYNQFQYFDRQDSASNEQNNTIIALKPRASTIHDKWEVSVGMGIYIDLNGDSPFHFYPQAEAKYILIDGLFVPYVGVNGQLDRTTFKTVTQENPFVVTEPELKSVNNKIDLYGGIRGRLSGTTSYNIKLAQKSYEDFMYFVNDSTYSPGSQFQILYDDLSFTNLTGEVTVDVSESLRFYARGDYFIYSPDVEKHPWNQPNTKLSLAATYNMQNKLLATVEVYTMGKRKAKSLAPVKDTDPQSDGSYIVTLKGFADVNLGIEYRYTKRLSAFLQFNNMFAGKYAYMTNYRVQNFQAMMGATYAF